MLLKLDCVELPRSGLSARITRPAPKGGVTAVFLHGLGGSSAVWPIRGKLPEGAAAVFLDLPGHGRARAGMKRDFAAIADQLMHAIDELGIGRTVLVGHSMGGILALTLEPKLGARNLETFLFSTGATFADVSAGLAALRRHEVDWAKRAIVPRMFGSSATPALLRMAAAGANLLGIEMWIAGMEVLEGYDAVRDLPALPSTPRWLLYGTEDRMVEPRESVRLAHFLGAKSVEVPGVGHLPMIEQPSACRPFYRQAFARCGSGWRTRGSKAGANPACGGG